VSPRAGLDDVEKILDPTETRTPTLRSSSPQPVAILTELWIPGAISPGGKAAGSEADYSPPSSAEVENGGARPSFPHTSSWRGV
jgi:hypothetical protein